MRAIIIKDADARALIDQLKLVEFKEKKFGDRLPEGLAPDAWRKAVIEEVHASFHLAVCRWLQDQGAELIR
jgi:hypothetical protein